MVEVNKFARVLGYTSWGGEINKMDFKKMVLGAVVALAPAASAATYTTADVQDNIIDIIGGVTSGIAAQSSTLGSIIVTTIVIGLLIGLIGLLAVGIGKVKGLGGKSAK